METNQDGASIVADLMDSVLTFQQSSERRSEAFRIVFNYLPTETLKECRVLSDMNTPATQCLQSKTRVNLENVASLQSYLQDLTTNSMRHIWEHYCVTISSKVGADTFLQICTYCGEHVKYLELDLKYIREVNLSYLEDLLSEKLPNLREFTLKGKFPSGAMFLNPNRMIGKLPKLDVFNLFATNWHRLLLPNGEISYDCPIIGQLLIAMPNISKINYFPDVNSPRGAHKHYKSFLINLTETENVTLKKLKEINHFPLSFVGVHCMEKFAGKMFPLTKLHILVEEEVSTNDLCLFLETFRSTLTSLVIRSATENLIIWPRLLQLEELTLIGVNVVGTNFLTAYPSLKTLQISQDRVTTVDFPMDRSLQIPHTLTCLKIVETTGVTTGDRLTDTGLAIIFRDLPFLSDLTIIHNGDSTRNSFTDEGVTGSTLLISEAELLARPRDLRIVNGNIVRYSHFIGNLLGLRRLTLKSSNISDVSLLCGIVNCQRLDYLDISSPKITEKAYIEMMDYINLGCLRIEDSGDFTAGGKTDILVRMKFQGVFYTT